MMIFNKYKNFWLMAFAITLVVSCSEEEYDIPVEEVIPLTAGSADFSKFVAVGASFSAGFTDGALFQASQSNSFPNLLAGAFANAGGGEFTQPLTNDNIGGLLLGGVQIQNPRLYFDGAGISMLDATPTNEVSNVIPGPYNNMGVPGAKSFHLLANGYGNVAGVPAGLANPYFARMASSSNASMLEDAASQAGTFFTLSEIGGNDVLSFALSGGSGVDQTGNFDPTTYGSTDITDPNVFAQVFVTIADALTANGAKGIVSNVPYITSLSHFTTVPYNPVPLDAATAAQLNGAFAPYNGGLLQAEAAGLISSEERAARTINFVAGQNAVTMVDEDLTDITALGLPSYRHATSDDLLVLPSSSFIGTVVGGNPQLINGVSVPLEDKWVLTPQEQQAISTATDAYNTTIEAVASAKGLAFVDFKSLLIEASNGGLLFDNFNMTTQLVFGGLVSLDGVHLTTRGYALMANRMLEAIDATYGSNFQASGSLLKADDYTTMYPEGL
ncbi:MAG: G-D-S-L family lipolytic protein [Flavobacteriaceae bacterium]|nr:G-D-S-L family lipolytic protein [Flavobacteriaceae bacterium]